MKIASRLFSSLLLLALVGTFPTLVSATTTPAHKGPPSEPTRGYIAPGSSIKPTGELKSCFDYYQFGSVQVSIDAQLLSVAAGAPMALTAKVKNTNAYPVVDTTVYVKIFHQQSADLTKNVNGPDVVDFFPIAQNITLQPGETKQVQVIWKVPGDMEPGLYRISTYAVQDDRFNFEGLTFTDDVTGGSYNFSIINSQTGAVRFDKTSGMLVGKQYRFAAYAPAVSQEIHDVPIRVTVANTLKTSYVGDVTWKTYVWDGLRPSTLLETSVQHISLSSNASTTVSHVVTDTHHTVYYTTAELTTSKGAKSIVGFRFVRFGGSYEARLSSVDVTGYPLGGVNKAFVCFHSTGYGVADDARVDVSVKALLPVIGDAFSFLPLGHTSYSGSIPGNLVAITVPLTQRSDSFEVVAKLYQHGKLVDQVTVPYTCEALGKNCSNTTLLFIIGSVLALLLLAFLIWRAVVARRKATTLTVPHHTSLGPPTT